MEIIRHVASIILRRILIKGHGIVIKDPKCNCLYTMRYNKQKKNLTVRNHTLDTNYDCSLDFLTAIQWQLREVQPDK